MVRKKSGILGILLLAVTMNGWANITTLPLEYFSQLQLNGAMQVEVKAAEAEPKLEIEAAPPQLSRIRLDIKQQQLIIEERGGCCKLAKPKLTIYVPEIRALTVIGNNDVKVSNLHVHDFKLFSANQGEIAIQGVIGLKTLVARGSGLINIYWLNSPELRVIANGKINILLGGRVRTLKAMLSEKSSLNARYLNTADGYIRAMDYARADVSVKQTFNAEALGNSNIYYYEQPIFLGQHMFEFGSVLNVVGQPVVE